MTTNNDYQRTVATLITRCGAMRSMELPFPPPPVVHVPLRTSIVWTSSDGGLRSTLQARTFVLDSSARGGPIFFYADYKETE
jgi:hypothetical protein